VRLHRAAPRFARFPIAVLLGLIAALALPASSLAFPYVAKSPIGSAGTGNGQLELGEHSGVAVNLTTHDLYVADSENHRVVVFGSNGTFIRAFGADVGGAGVDVCTSSCVAGTSESAPGAFENPTFVAIDNNPLSPSFEDVYVADNKNNLVSKFEADGTLMASWGANGQLDGSTATHGPFDELNGKPTELVGIAVDSSGNLFVKQRGVGGFMFKFDQAGTFLEDFTTQYKKNPLVVQPSGIAVDSSGSLYVIRLNLVTKLSPAGTLIEEDIGCAKAKAENFGCAQAIAVDPTNDDLYIASNAPTGVERLNSAGEPQETFGSFPEIMQARGIAVDPGLETVYLADLGSGSDRIDVFGPPPPAPPSIGLLSFDDVTSSSAVLHAEVNPNKVGTHARFQYVTQAQFEASGFAGAAETADEDLGSGKTPQALSAQLSGLADGTTYRFRVVASNELGKTTTPEPAPRFATFATPLAGLPDGRAYEMVSPSQKAGEVIPPEPFTFLGGSCNFCLPGENSSIMPMQSTPDGESVLYEGQPFSGGLAAGPNEYIADRAPAGWASQSLSSPVMTGVYEAFSFDLSRAVLRQPGLGPVLSPEAPTRGGESFENLYLRDESGSLQPLVTEEPPNRDPRQFEASFAGANAGTSSEPAFEHLAFTANDALTEAVPGIAPAAPAVEAFKNPSAENCTVPGVNCNLYEWVGGQLRLVNVLPGNASAASNAVIGSGNLLVDLKQTPSVDHAISDDGSRVFWSSEETGQLYVRIDGEETLGVPGPGSCKKSVEVGERACFLTATPDGSAVLLSDGQLYELNGAGSAYVASADLTEGESGFEGILGAAEDLSRIYFVDAKALTDESEENANGEHAEAGELNLYGWDEGGLTFIGILVGADNSGLAGYGAWMASPSLRTAQVSADGSYLAFMSAAPLTGYDSDLRSGGKCTIEGPACREAFLYSADSESLTCASCNPTGQRPLGPSNLSLLRPGLGGPFPQPSNLSADGSGRLFFESQDTLSPRDQNGHIQDVYEWEPNGVGSCKRPDGCVYLISSGQSPGDSMFVDATPSGKDAFFITREQLVLRDKDEQLDLYDARVGGGIAEDTTPPCLGEACRGPLSGAPEQPGPTTSSFAGPGNEKPKKQKKKKKRKHKSHKRAAKHNRGAQK
jgi:NHL repeat